VKDASGYRVEPLSVLVHAVRDLGVVDVDVRASNATVIRPSFYKERPTLWVRAFVRAVCAPG